MSVRAGAIEEAICFRNLGEIWSGSLALCGFLPRSSFFTPLIWMLSSGAVLAALVQNIIIINYNNDNVLSSQVLHFQIIL